MHVNDLGMIMIQNVTIITAEFVYTNLDADRKYVSSFVNKANNR